MTAFILVAGAHTGGWIWRETAERLRASGAGAYPAALTGLDGPPAGPGTDLETHIEDLVRLIDGLDAPDLVLVAHGYGARPALGAADRRPGRVSRIVLVDTAPPQDGEPALASVPGLSAHADGLLPPPAPGEWQRHGSTAGVPEAALAGLARLAAPHPVASLTQPLKLSGTAAELPATGVLCTANGSSIALVEQLVGLGDPRLRPLTDPRVSFFELGTGHWPMLSAPGELAGVLLRAAAGEGRRLDPSAGERPAHTRPFVLDVPERPRERIGRLDLYLPDTDRPRPAVVLVHGGPVPPDLRPTPRDWPAFTGYGRYAAELGVVGVTLDHRLHTLDDYPRAAEDVAEAVETVRAHPRVDGERVALWYFSAGGLLSADPLAAPPPWLRCVALSYPVLAPLPDWGLFAARFRPAEAVRAAGRLPVVLTRVELELPEIAATVAEFTAAADECGADVEVVDVPLGHHGFDTTDDTEEARRAVERAMRSVLGHLDG